MSGAIPKEIRDALRAKLWIRADELKWFAMSDRDRAKWYGHWTKDVEIGGVISHFMDSRKIRVYLKDSLLKPYMRLRLEHEWSSVRAILQAGDDPDAKAFRKPHGRIQSGQVICWASSRDWKTLLISVFERAYANNAKPFAAVLLTGGKVLSASEKQIVHEAGSRLGIERIEWLD